MKESSLLTDRTARILDRDRDDELYAAELDYKEHPFVISVRRRLNAAKRRWVATETRVDKWRDRIIVIS